jgi:hypothetical protein
MNTLHESSEEETRIVVSGRFFSPIKPEDYVGGAGLALKKALRALQTLLTDSVALERAGRKAAEAKAKVAAKTSTVAGSHPADNRSPTPAKRK